MKTTNLFDKFCHAVNDTIFSKENIGDIVAFIIDQAFIDDFCKNHSTTEAQLMQDIRRHLYLGRYWDHLYVKGILAIQLYAATKREDSDGITAANYTDRLSQVLNWNKSDYQKWMEAHQDAYWSQLYQWCDTHHFAISKCLQTIGKGRYVQYPIQQARRVFTQKDLKEIAYYFVQKKLFPGEDIQETDFWKIVQKRFLSHYIHNSHGKRLLENPDFLEDAYRQIFNFYLRWDGSYLNIEKNRNEQVEQDKYLLYLLDTGCLDVRDKKLKRLARINWENLIISNLKGYYSFKRERVIVFKKSEDYNELWEETRYIEGQEGGMAIVFSNNKLPYSYGYGYSGYDDASIFSHLNPIFLNKNIKVYRFSYDRYLAPIYSEKRYFALIGGLKVGRMTYLQGGAPILQMDKESLFWIDGEVPAKRLEDGSLLLDFLALGKHYVKFPGFKKLEFSIVKSEPIAHSWESENYTWRLSKEEPKWEPSKYEGGIKGIDFSSIKILNSEPNGVLTRWAEFHAGLYRQTIKEENIALRIITNQ